MSYSFSTAKSISLTVPTAEGCDTRATKLDKLTACGFVPPLVAEPASGKAVVMLDDTK